jgi:transposase-like protein
VSNVERSSRTSAADSVDDDVDLSAACGVGHDREAAAETAPVESAASAGGAEGRKRGRKSKLTPEIREMLCAGAAEGLPVEATARRAGIGPSTLHRWREVGAEILATRSEDETLSELEYACFDLEMGLRQAEAEYFAGLHAKLAKATTNPSKKKTTVRYSYLRVGNDLLRGEDGKPRLVPTYTVEVTQEDDVHATAALYPTRPRQSSQDRPQ